jgi:hypothetical protein
MAGGALRSPLDNEPVFVIWFHSMKKLFERVEDLSVWVFVVSAYFIVLLMTILAFIALKPVVR